MDTFAQKVYSLSTHDYKNTKFTEFLAPARKKRATHPSSAREPIIDFRKLDDKLKHAEIGMN